MSHPITKEEFRRVLREYLHDLKSKGEICPQCKGMRFIGCGNARVLSGKENMKWIDCDICDGKGYINKPD